MFSLTLLHLLITKEPRAFLHPDVLQVSVTFLPNSHLPSIPGLFSIDLP